MPDRLSDEAIAKLVREYLSGGLLFACDVPRELQPQVFMPIAFGAFKGWPEGELEQVTWYGRLGEDTVGCIVNGFPVVTAIRLMLIDDFWRFVEKARAAEAALRGVLGD